MTGRIYFYDIEGSIMIINMIYGHCAVDRERTQQYGISGQFFYINKVCSATLEFDYRFGWGWVGVGVGLGLGWG